MLPRNNAQNAPSAHDLRPYQRECIQLIKAAHRAGRRRLLVSLPTGTGKTVVFVSFVREMRMKKKLLILAHREELLEQAGEKLARHAPDVSVTIEQAKRRADPNAQVVLASVPTLGRRDSRRLATLNPGDFSIVVVDEAHHAVAESYRMVLDHFGLFAGSDRLFVGFTATPRRGDGHALGEVFEQIVYSRGIEEMIREKWLCDLAGWRVTTDVSLDDVKVRHGDFIESQLAKAVNVRPRNEAVLDAYCKYASGRKAIVFCVDVAHAQEMANTFASAGITAKAVWGAMGAEERRDALDSFRQGRTSTLTNCGVLTEGFDEPSVDCVIMARPTRSRLLYAQMIGRGTRPHPHKHNLLVIDVVDNSREHSLAGLHHVFDLPENLNLEGHGVLAMVDFVRETASEFPWIDLEHAITATDMRIVREAIDGVVRARHALAERFWLFSFDPPAAIRGLTEFTWHDAPGGDYALDVGGERLLATQNLLGNWTLLLLAPGRRRELFSASRPEEVIKFADDWVKAERSDNLRLVSLDAHWRELPASEKQLDHLRRKRAPIPARLTRGQASWIISHLSHPTK